MTPMAEPGDPSKAEGRGMIAAPAHPSLNELQPPRGRNQPQEEGGEGEGGKDRRHGSREGNRKRKRNEKERKERRRILRVEDGSRDG